MIGSRRSKFSVVLTMTAMLIAALIVLPGGAEDEGKSKPAYVVVLQDGTNIPATAKPISAFGTFRYMDVHGRTRTLPVSAVDLDRTRAANAGVTPEGRGGTLNISGSISDPPLAKMDAAAIGGDEGAVKKKNLAVRVYSATWCGYCKSLKKFLAEEGISATVIDVDTLPEAEQKRMETEMKRLTGRVSFPTVVIGDAVIAGFSPSWIRKALER